RLRALLADREREAGGTRAYARPDPPRHRGAVARPVAAAARRAGSRRRGRAARPGDRLAGRDGDRGRRGDDRAGAGSRPLSVRVRIALMVHRRDLLAYLIGAGVAGTLL